MNHTGFVDIFHGAGEVDLPEAAGIAATWYPFKGMAGNTNPAAILPFGKYAVCPYSGGYSSGYGINRINGGDISTGSTPVGKLADTLRLKGFSHFQNSGTGAIGIYYNYAVVTPFYGEKQESYGIREETGHPGYYSVVLEETDIRCELTVSEYAAYHRYTFAKPNGKIDIDFSNDGLYAHPGLRGTCEDLQVWQAGASRLCAAGTLQGIRLYFVVSFEGNGMLDAQNCYQVKAAGSVLVRLSVSALSIEDAWQELGLAEAPFAQVMEQAELIWEDALGRIHVESEDETELQIFYSNLYHSLVKPNVWERGGFLTAGKPMVVDFATMWDIYKTQLPLVYTLYLEVSEQIVDTFMQLHDRFGVFPNAFLLSADLKVEAMQARMLAEYSLYDAWKRGTKADWNRVADMIVSDLDKRGIPKICGGGNCASGDIHTGYVVHLPQPAGDGAEFEQAGSV